MITALEKDASTKMPDAMIAFREPKGSPVLTPSTRKAESLTEQPRILEEVVIEEVSIDGMCGVY